MPIKEVEDERLLERLMLCERMHGWTLEYVEAMDDLQYAKVKALLRGLDEGLAVLRDPKYAPNLG